MFFSGKIKSAIEKNTKEQVMNFYFSFCEDFSLLDLCTFVP